eukprot:688460-Pleurochrysis_carterae.AAC.3
MPALWLSRVALAISGVDADAAIGAESSGRLRSCCHRAGSAGGRSCCSLVSSRPIAKPAPAPVPPVALSTSVRVWCCGCCSACECACKCGCSGAAETWPGGACVNGCACACERECSCD